MKGFLLAVIFLIIGGVAGAFLALGVCTGLGAAGGIIVGSQAGVCFVVVGGSCSFHQSCIKRMTAVLWALLPNGDVQFVQVSG